MGSTEKPKYLSRLTDLPSRSIRTRKQLSKMVPFGRKKSGNGVQRAERLEVIYQRLMDFEFEHGLTNPILENVELINVEMQNQLSVLRIHVGGDAQRANEIKEALKRAKGYLRGKMSSEVPIMRTPDIKFIFYPMGVEAQRKPSESNMEQDFEDDYEWDEESSPRIITKSDFGVVVDDMLAGTNEMQDRMRKNL